MIGTKRGESETPRTKWLTTFNDMITLLLVFFVLLFTMSTVDVKRLYKVSHSLRSGLSVLEEGKKTEIQVNKYEQKKIVQSIKKLQSEPGVDSKYTKQEIYIYINDHILFKSGSARIAPEGFPVLDKVVEEFIFKLPGSVRIEGHTDNVPIRYSRRYPSNWELSIARAVNVVKYFVEQANVPPERLSAVGYGESKPLFPNDTPENRSKNRRVEIVVDTEVDI